VEEVAHIILSWYSTILTAFDYYAALSTGSDIFSIQLTSYLIFLDHCGIIDPKSAFCKPKDVDQLFVQVNAPSADQKDNPLLKDDFNKLRTLNRQEWLQVLVRLAAMKYVMPGQVRDMSEALAMLLEQQVAPRLPSEALPDQDGFRRACCYREEVDAVLRKHEKTLRAIYEVYSFGDGHMGEACGSSKHMAYDDFMRMCGDFDAFDAKLPQRDGALIFTWSRMRVANESTPKSRVKLLHLTFEDFLEAIMRLASAKAMPTDGEIAECGHLDGGTFMLALAEQPKEYAAFLDVYTPVGPLASRWRQQRQPIWRAADHLLAHWVRIVEASVKCDKGGFVDKAEAKKFRGQGGKVAGAIVEGSPGGASCASVALTSVNAAAASSQLPSIQLTGSLDQKMQRPMSEMGERTKKLVRSGVLAADVSKLTGSLERPGTAPDPKNKTDDLAVLPVIDA